ncbi:phosphotransferase [Bacillus mycoides]|uniref:phosphotransferase n=1 Tax=Bacillus mycoides TaxID=1405 RepID=UPI003D24866E
MYFIKDENFISKISKHTIESYLTYFLPGCSVENFRILPNGTENTSILVQTLSQSYLLRISTLPITHSMANTIKCIVQQEIEFMEKLRENKILIPKIYKTINGDSYIYKKDNQQIIIAVLMEWIDGVHEEYTIHNVRETAKNMAALHKISRNLFPFQGIPNKRNYSIFSNRLEETEQIRTTFFPSIIYKELKSIYDPISQILKDNYVKSPQLLIHNDLKADNIFWKNNYLVGIIDFADSRFSIIEEDLGVFIWDMCDYLTSKNEGITEYLDAFLNSYFEQNNEFSLFQKEIAILYAIDRYLTINLHYLVKNQVNLEHLHYQIDKAEFQLQIIKDLLQYRKDRC